VAAGVNRRDHVVRMCCEYKTQAPVQMASLFVLGELRLSRAYEAADELHAALVEFSQESRWLDG
jgi:hypothetical protein